MGIDDKIRNAGDKAAGKIKEASGRATDDKSQETEGRADQAKADLREATEKVKDAFKR